MKSCWRNRRRIEDVLAMFFSTSVEAWRCVLLPCTLIPAMSEANKVIYSMVGVTKRHDKKVVLNNIYLSYFYGAKIGVLGLNGSGKSSLLRILAGVDKNFEGQISLSAGYTIGFLEQEPQLGAGRTVRDVVEE